jgi:hypothetical protein
MNTPTHTILSTANAEKVRSALRSSRITAAFRDDKVLVEQLTKALEIMQDPNEEENEAALDALLQIA